MKRSYLIIFGIVLLLLDQLTKLWARTLVVGESVTAIPNVLWFTHVHNTGSAFSLLQGQNTLLMIVSVIALVALWYYRKNFSNTQEQVALVLLLSGIIGNLLDRIFLGHVTDFLDLGWWPVFNVADSCLVVGILVLVYVEFQTKSAKSA